MKHNPSGSLSLRAFAGLMLALCIGLAHRSAADASRGIPLPEIRRERSRSEQQRIRYLNSPLLELAQQRVAQEDYTAAEKTLTQVIANDPDNNHARVMLINVLNELGLHDRAKEQVDELLAVYPDAYTLHLERAFIHLREEKWEAAAEDLQRFNSSAPEDHPYLENALQQRADIAFRLKRPDEAATLMRELLTMNDTAERRIFMAECAIEQEQWAEAVTELRTALPLTDSPELHALLNLKLGYALFNLGHHPEAEAALVAAEAFFDQPPELLDILRQRALLAYREERFAAAAQLYTRYLDHEFDETVAISLLDAFQFAGQIDEALRYGNLFAAREETSEAFLLNVLEHLMNLHILRDDHGQTLQTAETLYHKTGALRFLLIAATAAAEAGRLDESAAHFRAFLSRTDDADAALAFHYVLRRKSAGLRDEGRPEDEILTLLGESVPHLTRIIEDPETPAELRHTALYELAGIRREQRDMEAAAALLQALIDDPGTPVELRRTAQYELAQAHRTRGDMEAYVALLQKLIEDMPEGRFLYEYAMHLYGSGKHDQAMDLLEQAFEAVVQPALRYQICKAMSDILLIRHEPREAIQWLERGLDHGEPDRYWHLNRARADYQMERFDDTIARLLPIAGDEDLFHMYIGFSFYNRHPQMPGLALTHMNRVGEPKLLAKDEQFNFYANRAYLHYDQYRDDQAIADIEEALSRQPSNNLELVRLRSLLRTGVLDEVLDRGQAIIDTPPSAPTPEAWPDPAEASQSSTPGVNDVPAPQHLAFLAQVLEVMGAASYRLEQWRDAVTHLSQALELNSDLLQARYLRGLSLARLDDLDEAKADLLVLETHADTFPATFLGDMAFLMGDLKEYKSGIEWLDRSLEMYPFDLDGWQERGYQSMKDHRNEDARISFAEAIRLYDEILPYVEPEQEAETYNDIRLSLKQEYTKLDKVWSFQLYGQRTDFDFNESALPAGVPAESTQGALVSQGGVSVGYRPPGIGFRDEKTFDLFVRVLANLEPRSWQPDNDSYQGGAGLMYKPFNRHNYIFGFERLFKIGDDSEDNWLWRNTYGLESGKRPPRHKDVWVYRRLYGEASYYLESPRRWVFVGQGNIGPSYALTRNLMLTFPEALAYGRYQDDDPTGVGTYWYYGPGLNISLLEGERELTRDRWALVGYAHYVWGRFDKAPEGMDEDDFKGWIIGIRLTR